MIGRKKSPQVEMGKDSSEALAVPAGDEAAGRIDVRLVA